MPLSSVEPGRWLRLLWGVILGSGLMLVRPAIAAESADNLIDRGIRLREARKDREALELFERAYKAEPSARAQAQIGLAQQALGLWVEAETSLVDALSSNHPWVENYRTPIENALTQIRSHLGNLEIAGNTQEGEVFIDGKLRAKLPLESPLRVVAGTFPIEVRRNGYWPVSRTVTVEAGSTARESVQLTRRTIGAHDAPGDSSNVTAFGSPKNRFANPWGWALAGVGVASMIGGGVALAIREGHVSDFNSDECLQNGLTRIMNCPEAAAAANRAQNWAIVGFTAGSASLIASGLVFWLVNPSMNPSDGAASFTFASDRATLTWTQRW